MRILILAAGYATRLYPLTLTQPKPLLPVAGKPMIDHVIDNLAPIAGIDDTNSGAVAIRSATTQQLPAYGRGH